jgi:hypothetical protein
MLATRAYLRKGTLRSLGLTRIVHTPASGGLLFINPTSKESTRTQVMEKGFRRGQLPIGIFPPALNRAF